MRKLIQSIIILGLCVAWAAMPLSALAGKDGKENSIDGPFANNVSVETIDDKFQNPNFTWTDIINRSVQNTVSLRVVDNVLINYSFNYTANIKIEYYTDPAQSAPTVVNTALTVSYAPGAGVSYKGMDTYNFTGAYRVKVTVLSTSGMPPQAGMVRLTNRIEIDRSYKLYPQIALGAVYTMSARQLKINLLNLKNVEEFDVEWTTINNGNVGYQAISTGRTGTYAAGSTVLIALEQAFRNNASRVTLTGRIDYTLPLVTTDDLVLVRIRQAQYNDAGIRVTGDWDYRNGTTYAAWPVTWNEGDLNWQYATSFAEEGKRKEVISYFDGTLRGRQTETVNNSDNTVVVQENVYDPYGRVTASILPAPVPSANENVIPYLQYVPNFNLNSSGLTYTYGNMTVAGGAFCELNPAPLSTNAGASKYYSPNNFILTKNQTHDFVPDAAGYPLSVTQYTNDNTGRIKIQGGVGLTYQPGKSINGDPSRVTKYYYGKPEQWELDQLFGNDAGYAEHYLKNMVVDPNGQISVSYLNASGKTVATALTGQKPDVVDPLPSYQPVTGQTEKQNIQLMRPERFVYDAGAMKLSATTTYLASVMGTNTLKFDMQKLVNNYPGSFQICSSCYYNMTIIVTDDCANMVASKTAVKVGSDIINDCTTGTYEDSMDVPVTHIGEYNVYIEFAFDNAVIDKFADNFVAKGIENGYLEKQFDYIKARYLTSLDVSGCYTDCHTCSALLGGQTEFVAMLRTKITAMDVEISGSTETSFNTWANVFYLDLKSKCTAAEQNCTYSPCESMRNAMLMDVSPGGQYALFDQNGEPLEPEINVIKGTGTTENWRLQFPVKPSTDPDYQNELITLPDGSVTSPYDVAFTRQMLVIYWKTEWAEKFLNYHPEVCQLNYCINTNAPFKNWDMRLQEQINTAASIATINPQNPVAYSLTNPDWLLDIDPYFNTTNLGTGAGTDVKTQMHNDLVAFSTNVLHMTGRPEANSYGMNVKGLTQYVDYLLYCADVNGNTNNSPNSNAALRWNNCTPNPACRVTDREWLMYRDYYLELKEKYYNTKALAQCGGSCIIGEPISYRLPGGCAVAADFSIRANDSDDPACAGKQSVLLVRDAGAVTQSTTVELYYPSALDNASLTHSIVFATGEAKKSICVPNNIPLSVMHVKQVTCGTGGSGSGGTGTPAPANLIYVNLESFDTQDICGPILSGRSRIRIRLLNPSGALVNATNEISVRVSVKVVNYGAGTTTDGIMLVVLPVGSNTAYSNPFVTNAHNCGTQTNVQCVKEVIGGDLSTSSNLGKCSDYTSSPYVPPISSCPVAYKYKKARFESIFSAYASQEGNTPADPVPAAKAEIIAQAVASCEAQADSWIRPLQPGLEQAGLTSKITDLRNALLEVCTAGADENHLFGASSVPAPTVHSYTDFGDAIKKILPLSAFTPTLNPWLIDGPPPYTKRPQMVVNTISSSSEGICDKLNGYSQQATAAGKTLYNYLKDYFGAAMTLTQSQLTALQNSCNNCRYVLSQDMDLPVFLDPANPGYITYSSYTSAKSQMNGLFSSPVPSTHPNYNHILANFMNNYFGFALTADDYKAFEAAGNPSLVLVNNLPYNSASQDNYECVKNALSVAVSSGKLDYENYIAENRRLFRENYINTCKLAKANASLSAVQQVYHYTLYYYDQADNLVRTIPPEGVKLFDSSLFNNIDKQRDNSVNQQAMNYNGPTTASTVPDAMTGLSTVLQAPQGAIAMWFYNDGSNINHFVEATPDKKFIFEVSISGSSLIINVFPTTQNQSSDLSFVATTGSYQADISALLPLDKFVHLVMQGNALGTAGTPQLYLNGTKLTLTPGAGVQSPYGFTVTAASPNVILPDDSHYIKHMLLYDHVLPEATIKADAAQIYFAASEVPNKGWYRFNVPVAGTATTVNNTTNETVLYEHYNAHTLPTTYVYNSTNQVNQQNSPDGGTNRFWYDLLSRLVASQNDKQRGTSPLLNNYCYTRYDALGRITEVGQKNQTTVTMSTPDFMADATVANFLAAGTNSQITQTWYDVPSAAQSSSGLIALTSQNNLRKRVAASSYRETQSGPVLRATYYDYDLDGNVKTLWQQIDGLAANTAEADLKRIDYEYDLVSGKVNNVLYQDGKPDQFYYSYTYDAENRLKQAWTGRKAITNAITGSTLLRDFSKQDAAYYYYLHGPLRRTEIGDVNGLLQGVDYAYTLQGWLKGVNSTSLTPTADMGADGTAATIPRDAYGYNLYYNNTDYTPIKPAATPFATTLQTSSMLTPMYNGNIAGSSVNIPKLGADWIDRTYKYDQLNRILNVKNYHTASAGATPVTNGDYDEAFTYDANGNILTLNRVGAGTGLQKDVMSYKYALDANGKITNNRLTYMTGTAAASGITGSQAANNYKYDLIGNLISDTQAGITNIDWTVYGKIGGIAKGSSSAITYSYDAGGNRVSKTTDGLTTWYVRDAQGNPLAVYNNDGGSITWREQQLYGSARLGMWQPNVSVSSGDAQVPWLTTGNRQYELSNHLGNVMVTLSDKRLQHTSNNTSVDYFEADVTNAQDYYAFGSLQPARTFAAGSNYRYGFNGKENDNEVKGVGNQQDYGLRIYDPRIGRFLSTDPLSSSYPWYTPYQFAGNKPIWATDLDGAEENTMSTYVYHPPVLAVKPAFKGIISITDATSGTAHRNFEGDFARLAKADPSRFSLGIVNSLVGSNLGAKGSRLDITMTGVQSRVSKTWKGTDLKYFTQYSYSLMNNNVVEVGKFEVNTGTVQASARTWDPLLFIVMNKAVSSLVNVGVAVGSRTAFQSSTIESLQASQKVYNGATLYRLGTTGISKVGAEAQYWSLENPLSMGLEQYAKKYGVSMENLQNADFLETATLKQGAKYITREAPTMPGAPAGAGGGVEAVVEQGGTTGNIITPVKK